MTPTTRLPPVADINVGSPSMNTLSSSQVHKQQQQQQQQQQQAHLMSTLESNSQDARFSCNICFEAVIDPVVTQCGHLYCWPCLYRWLEPGMYPRDRLRLFAVGDSHQQLAEASLQALSSRPSSASPDMSRRVCPVCKAGCSVDTIVPIYVRAADTTVATFTPSENEPPAVFSTTQEDPSRVVADRIANDDDDVDSIASPTSSLEVLLGQANTERDDGGLDPTVSTGLRQRRATTVDSHSSMSSDVPRRPLAPQSPVVNISVPQASTTATPTATTIHSSNTTPVHPQQSVPSFGRQSSAALMLFPFVGSTTSTTYVSRVPSSSDIPVIHRPEGFNSPTHSARLDEQQSSWIESDPGATEFLSRILLMLGSFVIMCLLLF